MSQEGLEGIPESIQLPLVWVAGEELSIELGNQYLVQIDRDRFFLSIGQLAPPVILGTPQERFEQARALQFIPVKTVGRYALSRRNAEQLRDLLDQMIENFDAQTQGGPSDEPG